MFYFSYYFNKDNIMIIVESLSTCLIKITIFYFITIICNNDNNNNNNIN